MKKILAIIVIVIVCVCLFSRSCSKIEKTSRTIRFTELDKSIQDTLHSVWQTIHNVFREEDNVDLIDFTNDYVFVTRQDFFLNGFFIQLSLMPLMDGNMNLAHPNYKPLLS